MLFFPALLHQEYHQVLWKESLIILYQVDSFHYIMLCISLAVQHVDLQLITNSALNHVNILHKNYWNLDLEQLLFDTATVVFVLYWDKSL